jgi:cyclin-dependent kinase 7
VSVTQMISEYRELKELGQGGFGRVFLAERTSDKARVAVKKIVRRKQYEDEGLSALGCLREIRLMRETAHPNLVELLDVYIAPDEGGLCVCLVLELLCEQDLEQIIQRSRKLGGGGLAPAAIKSLTRMLLEGLAFLHSNWIMHRDLKPGNVFMSTRGVLKIGDFGFARTFGSPYQLMSPSACTQWYRAPELLLGACEYNAGVDVWSAGCIFGELWRGEPLFPGTTLLDVSGNNEIDQLGKIFMRLGTPNLEEWPGMATLSRFVEFQPCSSCLPDILPMADAAATTLLGDMLCLNPNKRTSCDLALQSTYFSAQPEPVPEGAELLKSLNLPYT